MDLSTLSDADLTALYHQSSNPLASLSDDKLKSLYASMSPSAGTPQAASRKVDIWDQFPDAPLRAAVPAVPAELTSATTDDASVNKWLGTLPEGNRDAARNAWANAWIAKQREDGGAEQRRSDLLSRATSSIPGLGSWMDELEAGARSLGGEDYANSLAVARARQRAIEATPTAKITSTPFGDVYAGGLEKAAGAIGGGLALPVVTPMRSAGLIPGAVNAGTTAGLYGAAQGAGEGEGAADRLAQAETSGLESAAAGAALGGTLGKLIDLTGPRTPNEAVQANQRLIDQGLKGEELPKFLATDSNVTRSGAGVLASQPLTGGIVRDAAQGAANDLGGAVRNVADLYSAAGTGGTHGATDATAAAYSAGSDLRQGLEDWVRNGSANELNSLYGNVYSQINPNTMAPLARTMNVAKEITDSADAAATPIGRQLMGHLQKAIDRGQLTVRGIQGLRTYIGALADDTMLPMGGTIQPALKRVYGALTTDLERALNRTGGPALVREWQQVNNTARVFSEQREDLAKIIGTAADATPEQIINRVTTMAGTNSAADIQRLLLARRRAGATTWNEVASAAVRRLGQGPSSNPAYPGMVTDFSPDRWLNAWGKLSPNGKNALFGDTGGNPLRAALDDVARVAQQFRDLRQYQNPSGTAHAAGGLALASAFFTTGPLGPIAQVVGAGTLSYLLSRPQSARAISRWGNAVYRMMTSSGGQAMARLMTLNLARAIAEQTGANKRDIRQRLQQTMVAAVH